MVEEGSITVDLQITRQSTCSSRWLRISTTWATGFHREPKVSESLAILTAFIEDLFHAIDNMGLVSINPYLGTRQQAAMRSRLHPWTILKFQIALPNKYYTILAASLRILLPKQPVTEMAATNWVYSTLVITPWQWLAPHASSEN